MKIIREYPTPVKQAEKLPLKDGMPWCEDHDEYYEVCICPKPYSTPEEDGWQVEQTPNGQIAFPTEELYKELSLWIQHEGHYLVCKKCGGKTTFPEGHVVADTESQDLVEAFFEIHTKCGEGNCGA